MVPISPWQLVKGSQKYNGQQMRERNTNHVKDSELASLFGKLKYEENLIDSIYETQKEKSLVSAMPLSTTFFSTSIVQDFQDSPDDEEDTRSSQEYLNDLEEEYQARDLLAKSKRFFKKVDQLTEDPSSSGQKDLVFVKSLANDTKVSKPGVERSWLSEAEAFILPNHDTNRIPPPESQTNTIEPLVVVTISLATDYDSADESLCTSEAYLVPWKWMLKAKRLVVKATCNKYVEQPRPSGVLEMTQHTTYEKLCSLKCKDIFDKKRGTIFNSNKEIVMIAPRVRDVYVLDMTSSEQESCFIAIATENLN
ncbi:hypothetical protein Tco_0415548 [Tanacetum coccineum]